MAIQYTTPRPFHLSQFSKTVPISTAYLRYAVCSCCLCNQILMAASIDHQASSFRSFVAPLSKVCYTIDRQEIRAAIKQHICDKKSNCYNVLSFVIFIIGNPRIISTILSRNDRKWHESLLRGIVLWYAVTRAFLKQLHHLPVCGYRLHR